MPITAVRSLADVIATDEDRTAVLDDQFQTTVAVDTILMRATHTNGFVIDRLLYGDPVEPRTLLVWDNRAATLTFKVPEIVTNAIKSRFNAAVGHLGLSVVHRRGLLRIDDDFGGQILHNALTINTKNGAVL